MAIHYRRPEKTMIYLYRRNLDEPGAANEPEYLLLKRSQSQAGHIWQPVVGAAQWDEELIESARREVFEETGVTRLQGLMAVGYAFSFVFRFSGQESHYPPDAKTIRNIVFAAQVGDKQQIALSDEHIDYGWFPYRDALDKLHWPEDKKALIQLHPLLHQTQTTGRV